MQVAARSTQIRMALAVCVAIVVLLLAMPAKAFAVKHDPNDVIEAELSADGRLDVTERRSNVTTSNRNYVSWGIFAKPSTNSVSGYYLSDDLQMAQLLPVDVTVDDVLIRFDDKSEYREIKQVEFSEDLKDVPLGSDVEECWAFDAENRLLYVLASLSDGYIDVMVHYHSDNAIWFGQDCAYLMWAYCEDVWGAKKGDYTLDLKLPSGAEAGLTAQEPVEQLRGFVYSAGNNSLAFDQKTVATDPTSSPSSEAHYGDGAVHVVTPLSFQQPDGKSGSGSGLELDLIMPRSWFSDDAPCPVMGQESGGTAPTYDELVEVNEKASSSNIVRRTKKIEKEREEAERKAQSEKNKLAVAHGIETFMYTATMACLVFLVVGFVVLVISSIAEVVYMRRPDPKTTIEPEPTNEVPDRSIHPLVFDELFFHEFDPEVRDFETEMLRLSAIGRIVATTKVENGRTTPYVKRGKKPTKTALDPIDNQAVGILFADDKDGKRSMDEFRCSVGDYPQRTASLFEDWKKAIKDQADASGYMQQRIPFVKKLNASLMLVYLIGTAISMAFLGGLVVLLSLGTLMLFMRAIVHFKPRIVLTEDGSRLCALGKGYCEWLENASPEEILDTDDERELADRLTYMAVFARDSWGPEKIEQVTALRPDDPLLASVRACYCEEYDTSSVFGPRPIVRDVSAAIDSAISIAKSVDKESQKKRKSLFHWR